MSKKNTFVLSCLILSVVIMFASCGDPKNIIIDAQAPLEVAEGETFQIVCTAQNVARKDQTLVSLDIADEYLEGVAIISTSPDYSDSMHVPIDNTQSYTFDLVVPPGETVTVVLDAMAIYPGNYRGDIDFCINSDFKFLSDPVQTIVK